MRDTGGLLGGLKEQMEEKCQRLRKGRVLVRVLVRAAVRSLSSEPGREELVAFSGRAETLEAELEASRGMEARSEKPEHHSVQQ